MNKVDLDLSTDYLLSTFRSSTATGLLAMIDGDEGVLIFDDTIQEKAWTDESELMCWHFDHRSGALSKASTF